MTTEPSQSSLTGVNWEYKLMKENELLDVRLPLNVKKKNNNGYSFRLRANLPNALKKMGFADELFFEFFIDIPSHHGGLPLIIAGPIPIQQREASHHCRKLYWDSQHGSQLTIPSCFINQQERRVANLGIDPKFYSNDNRLVFRVWKRSGCFALSPLEYESGREYEYKHGYDVSTQAALSDYS